METFLPLPSHRLALRKEIVVIRGGRGAGKSHLFKALKELQDPSGEQLRAFFRDERLPAAMWLEAFSQVGLKHPEATTLDAYAHGATQADLRVFWVGHLLRVLMTSELVDSGNLPSELSDFVNVSGVDPTNWVPVAQKNLGRITAVLDAVETHLATREKLVFATYDHLDRIGGFDPEVRRRYVSALLALWLSLSNRYRWLRAKIFLREDLFEVGELEFPDATKLRPRSVALEWDTATLYQVVIRHLARFSALREWMAEVEGLELSQHADWGWLPGHMGEEVQKSFANRLAGELMGSGVRKGYTYRWIPNRLQDANGRIVPRSMLSLFGFAAEEALKNPLDRGERILRTEDLVAALEPTSQARVGEIREEYPLVARIENLRGHFVLMDPATARGLLTQAADGELSAPPLDGRLVLDELRRLGVVTLRKDGRVDIPDIYRYGYGIKRKGGVARPR